MDLNISSNGGNASALTGYTPRALKNKGYGNFANSNQMSASTQTKKQVRKGRKGSKKRPLKGKQNLG